MARERSGRQAARRRAASATGARGAAAGGIEAGTYPIDAGTAQILPDPFTDGAWLLTLNGAESSQLNPDNPLDLGFEYMRWIAAVVMHRWDPQAPLRILHLGAAGCTLARWAAAWYPDSRQTAVELDAGLAALARERFALPRAPRLRIRVGEAG
ncbi:MAG TPA: spermidine synthase, partial [Citricoccus sp.]